MKDIIMKVLLATIALSAITYYLVSETGVWGDSQAIRDQSHRMIQERLVTPP